MARPKKDVSAYFGQKIQGTRLKVIKEAGRDSQGRILVKVLCDCKKQKKKVVILSKILSGDIKSCGCLKHELYVEYTQRAVDRLTPAQIEECFLATVDKNAPKPDLPSDVITAGYYRRIESLKSLPKSVMVTLRKGVMALDAYASIARDTALHAAEVAWLAKHVIRPEARRRREMKDHALSNIRYAKQGLEYERRRQREVQKRRRQNREREWSLDHEGGQREQKMQGERFSASQLHNPVSKASRKARLDIDSLDFSWHWMETEAPHIKLNSEEQNLLKWLRKTGERTFKWRQDSRREHAMRKRRERKPGWDNLIGKAA
jgi:hypothetical protein